MTWRRIARSRLVTAITTTAAVAAIVLGSVVGLDDWADGAATHVRADGVADGGVSTSATR